MTQKQMILSQLNNNSTVTKLTAYHLGVGNIHEVIRQLRKDGLRIDTVTTEDPIGRKYTKYVLS